MIGEPMRSPPPILSLSSGEEGALALRHVTQTDSAGSCASGDRGGL